MKSKIPLDIIVPLLAGASCLLTIPQLSIPVWGIFVGWAWYFALGSTPSCFKQIFPAIVPGAVLAFVSIILTNLFSVAMAPLPAMILSVIITVILLMLALKITLFNNSLVVFNAYSCVFATFYGGFYPQLGNFYTNALIALIWSMIANFLGPIFGYLSIYLTFSTDQANSKSTMSD